MKATEMNFNRTRNSHTLRYVAQAQALCALVGLDKHSFISYQLALLVPPKTHLKVSSDVFFYD